MNRLPRSIRAGDPLLGVISHGAMPLGSNRYDALLVKVEHRFSKGFSILNSFTYLLHTCSGSSDGPGWPSSTLGHAVHPGASCAR